MVATTAWQMLFDHGAVDSSKRVLVHGAAGNVGAYAVQMAKSVARAVLATAFPEDIEYIRGLGADAVINVRTTQFESVATEIDVVIDTVGGDMQRRSFAILKAGGVLVSSVEAPDHRHRTTKMVCRVAVVVGDLSVILHAIGSQRI